MTRTLWLFAIFTAAIAGTAAAVPARADSAAALVERVDVARARVWRLSSSGAEVSDPSGTVSIELPDWQWALPPYGCPPDLALGPGGEAVITSNVLPTLWRVDPRSLAVTVHPLGLDSDPEKDIGFSRIVYSGERGAYYALAEHHRTVWEIPTSLTDARKVPGRLLRRTLFGEDGTCAGR